MTARHLFLLALRVMGVWFAVQAVLSLGSGLVLLESLHDLNDYGIEWLSYAVMSGGVSMALLLLAPWFTSWFYSPEEPALNAPLSIDELGRTAVQVLGIYALLRAVAPLSDASVRVASALMDPLERLSRYDANRLVEAGLYVACAAFLIFRSRQIAEWISRLRSWPENVERERSTEPKAADDADERGSS